jgi:hypothetical protein
VTEIHFADVVNWQQLVMYRQLIVCEFLEGGEVNWCSFEMSSVFLSFLDSASPPLTVFPLSVLPSRLQCSFPCDFPPHIVVSSFALPTILHALLIPCLSMPSDQCHLSYWVDIL